MKWYLQSLTALGVNILTFVLILGIDKVRSGLAGAVYISTFERAVGDVIFLIGVFGPPFAGFFFLHSILKSRDKRTYFLYFGLFLTLVLALVIMLELAYQDELKRGV